MRRSQRVPISRSINQVGCHRTRYNESGTFPDRRITTVSARCATTRLDSFIDARSRQSSENRYFRRPLPLHFDEQRKFNEKQRGYRDMGLSIDGKYQRLSLSIEMSVIGLGNASSGPGNPVGIRTRGQDQFR